MFWPIIVYQIMATQGVVHAIRQRGSEGVAGDVHNHGSKASASLPDNLPEGSSFFIAFAQNLIMIRRDTEFDTV